ncbi:hypothetical protein [Saccharopolyspora hattusasensis]|uniref:hypothetical protein n=1 Tax=Saccharopolyspora hattusasensis TaxID=1128679 RepID=UPI003D99F3E7
MTYQVLIEELRKASDATLSAVDQARATRLGAAAERIGQALPGTTAAPAASDTGQSWTDTVAKWCRSGTDHAEALRRSADTYQTADHGAASNLRSGSGA